ncbi:Acetyltransferase (GNAT) family protein [Granulicella pectinivorans]|uniref:Acetyltransferase (GNAT) family protein n=1 Tax=Granulicella pectinivorans TaxID=474950 RepID=A0A1I6L7I4_9BACT|nr:GNAT family N-acetyltransferase [Granulicella pectinivorans]SFR99461.1 Acetyltransferase (GNAT) family protein [Granulicella pectinivorans]
MAYEIVVADAVGAEHRDLVGGILQEYNNEVGPAPGYFPVALLVKGEDGKVAGGLWGKAAYDWIFVEYLVVPKDARGQGLGSKLIGMVEEMARKRGLVGVWLDTFSFQALGFYEKLGYVRLGEIEDNPRGGARYFLKKRV